MGKLLQFVGIVCTLIVIIVTGALLDIIPRTYLRPFGWPLIMITVAIVAFFWNWGKRHLIPLAEEAVAKDPRPPIIYLRSFVAQTTIGKDEKVLAEIMGEAGPFVAIGKPGDTLPPLGASRFYVPDKNWKKFVRRLISRAALVILMAGRSQGLLWEMLECTKRVDPRCLIVLVPSDPEVYEAFRAQIESGTKVVLPEFTIKHGFDAGTLSGLIQFDKKWQGRWKRFNRVQFRGLNPTWPNRTSRRYARLKMGMSEACRDAKFSIERPELNVPHFLALFFITSGVIVFFVMLYFAIIRG